jgi:DNA-binding transcriptional MerR regulator
MALTVADIADLIRRPNADKAAVIERLRNWTAEGLLTPAGDRNPGTGRPRQYDDDAVYDAAILNALADHGLPIGKQRYFMMVLQLADEAKKSWVKKRRGEIFLEVADFDEPDVDGQMHAVFLHQGAKRGHVGNLIYPRAEGSLMLNVSRLFHRIEVRKAELKT